MSKITILGAGVAGLCVATALAERGARPRLIDPRGGPGAHGCSWWAGGMLAPFCESETAEEPVLRHGQKAVAWWGARTNLTRRGTLVLAPPRDLADLHRFGRRCAGGETCLPGDLEPDLGAFPEGLHFAAEAHLDPRRALADLASGLAARGIAIETDGTPEGEIVDCRGLAARDMLADLRGVRGEMLVIRCPDLALTRPVRLLHPRLPLYIVPRGDGVYMLGATMIEAEDRRHISARSMLELLSAAYAIHPGFGEAEILETGVDLRPAFPDNLPRLRRAGGRLHVNGLYRHGYLMAPALAEAAADWLLDGRKTELYDEDHG